ncbi:divergent PAP2 family protein [Candidatus Saccharibacteria bacterium]|nr:MAG: divergent PAP2 family protein [Candidatus Saccharibacteria bacterium]
MKLSPYLLAIVSSWVVAQGSKYLIVAIKSKNFGVLRQLYLSGNMPSAHSATVMSVATVVGFTQGFESALFGIAIMVAGVVMYDAIMVRRSVGEQGLAIQELIRVAKENERVTIPRAAKGHTPLEVLVGATLGALIGIVVFIATK